eukprot:3718718-Prymnesium_polylepis.1
MPGVSAKNGAVQSQSAVPAFGHLATKTPRANAGGVGAGARAVVVRRVVPSGVYATHSACRPWALALGRTSVSPQRHRAPACSRRGGERV